jgi:hypothetical protein
MRRRRVAGRNVTKRIVARTARSQSEPAKYQLKNDATFSVRRRRAPSSTSGPNASSSNADPRKSTSQIRRQASIVGDTPAAWTNAPNDPSSATSAGDLAPTTRDPRRPRPKNCGRAATTCVHDERRRHARCDIHDPRRHSGAVRDRPSARPLGPRRRQRGESNWDESACSNRPT